MEWAHIRADWETCGLAMQDRWGRLTEEDLTVARAGREELVSCVLKRYGIERTLAEQHVDNWIKSWG
jgi:uncharacterized protein YjbJ (UPF0337 family)